MRYAMMPRGVCAYTLQQLRARLRTLPHSRAPLKLEGRAPRQLPGGSAGRVGWLRRRRLPDGPGRVPGARTQNSCQQPPANLDPLFARPPLLRLDTRPRFADRLFSSFRISLCRRPFSLQRSVLRHANPRLLFPSPLAGSLALPVPRAASRASLADFLPRLLLQVTFSPASSLSHARPRGRQKRPSLFCLCVVRPANSPSSFSRLISFQSAQLSRAFHPSDPCIFLHLSLRYTPLSQWPTTETRVPPSPWRPLCPARLPSRMATARACQRSHRSA